MTEQNQSPREINKITGFFRTRKSKYIFVILEDERLLNDILVPVIDACEKKGLEVLHFPLKLTDYYVFQQIDRLAYHPGLQGLIVSGLNELIEKYGETFIDNLNRSRDAFQRLAVPIIWIIDQKNLQRIVRGASDFYQMRDLPDFHIQGAAKDTIPRLDINFFYNPYPGDKDIDEFYLEKQLAGIPAGSKYEKETVNGFVLPLLRRYIQGGDTDKMKNLYRSFLKDHEEIVNDPYILVAYYTAIGELDQSFLFPRHFVQPIFPGNDPVPDKDLHSEGLLKTIAEKKGVIVVPGDDCRVKSQLIAHTLGKLKARGFDFIVIYGETTPELILFNIALKAKERNDQKALKIVTGPQDIREKTNYFSEGFLARNKIAIILMHFEENQSEASGGECKSRRLRLFLNSLCESLRGKDSFLLISTCLSINGFSNYPIPGDRDMAVTGKRVEELPPVERNILDILSLFQKPVHPEILRFYDINPEIRERFYNLEKSSLIEIITYPGEANKENIRLYVLPFVSHLVQKSLDDPKKTDFHLKAGRYFENYFPLEEASYIEKIIEARRHFIAAKAWDNAAELTLKLFWPLHAQNFTQWALDLLNELEIEALNTNLKYHVLRRLGLLHYYRGAYFLSWENYKEALALVRDEDERYRLYSELLPVELSVNPGFNSNDRSVFKGIFHSFPDPPPLQIIQAGTNAILHYYSQIKDETAYLLECKIFLIGSGDVGKTTLMKKLINNDFVVEPGKEDPTRGIGIQPWQLSCPFPDGHSRNVYIHFWDFAGHKILDAPHQFFLTKRSLYLFVWDPRKEEETRTFAYWLNAVKLFGAGSPLIMVMNKSDMRIKHIDEASFQEKFPNIIQFHQVSCVTGDHIPELTETIRTTLCRMPHLLDKLPKRWLHIRNDLKAKVENYIPLDNYFDLCSTHGMDNEKALSLSEYLHDLGIILHFRHDPVLADTVILKPEWATGAVYALIDSLKIQQNKGRINRAQLDRYWDNKKYPTEKHPQLLRLIEKFELCFNIVGTEDYILPELLPAQRPSIDMEAYRSTSRRNLQLHYSYDFMPAGIITRFISRIYYLIRDEHYWNNGVELEFSGSTALVLGDAAQKRIRVSVSGNNNTQLMGVIRGHFDHIHQTLNMKKEEHVFEEVPCICSKCAASEKPFSYKYNLLQILTARKRDALCEKSSEDVSVHRLLNGLLPPLESEGIFDSLITTLSQLQGIKKTLQPDEDSRNTVVSLLLGTRGFRVKDQTLSGSSESGTRLGELDIKIEDETGRAVSIIEALNLDSLNTTIIDRHVLKLFHNYDCSGLKENYIVVYASAKDFAGLYRKYRDHLKKIDYESYPLVKNGIDEVETGFNKITAFRAHHKYNKGETILYHLLVEM